MLFARTGDGLSEAIAEAEAPGTIAAAYFAPHWFLFVQGNAVERRAVLVYEVRPGQPPQLVHEQDLTGAVHRVVGQDEAHVFTYAGDRLGIWRPSAQGLESVAGLETVSPPLRITSTPEGTMLVRSDGVTVLSPACQE